MEYLDDIHVSSIHRYPAYQTCQKFLPSVTVSLELLHFIRHPVTAVTCHLRLLWNAQQGACNPSIASTNTTANTTFLLALVFFWPLGSNWQAFSKKAENPRDPEIYFATMEIPIGSSQTSATMDDFCLKKWWTRDDALTHNGHTLTLLVLVPFDLRFFSERHVRCHQNDKQSFKKNIHPEEGGAMIQKEGLDVVGKQVEMLARNKPAWLIHERVQSRSSWFGGNIHNSLGKTCWSVTGRNITNLLSLAGIFQPVRVSEGKEETTTAFKH